MLVIVISLALLLAFPLVPSRSISLSIRLSSSIRVRRRFIRIILLSLGIRPSLILSRRRRFVIRNIRIRRARVRVGSVVVFAYVSTAILLLYLY